jgi:hypothetical protein
MMDCRLFREGSNLKYQIEAPTAIEKSLAIPNSKNGQMRLTPVPPSV